MPQLINPGARGQAQRQQQQQQPAQIVDVGRQPELKQMFLSGRITNLAAPFIYHDPAKDIAYVLMPMELNLRQEDQHRAVGQLMNAVQRGMPKEQIRAYLFNPRTFFTMQSMMEAILEKDGVTKEMLEAQREKSDFLRDVLRLTTAEDQKALIVERADKVDGTVFEMLGMNLDAAAQAGRQDIYSKLVEIENLLVANTPYGIKVGARAKVLQELQKTPSRETLLALITVEQDEQTRKMLVSMGRQLLDYTFFQQLSARIEAAPDADAKNGLISLRKEIQDTRLELEKAQREFMQEKATLINTILTSEDPVATARANAAQIDEDFLALIEANIAESQKRGQGPEVQKALEGVFALASQIIAEKQPPEVQIVQALLAAQYPDETKKILEELAEMSDSRFIQFMGQFSEQLAQQDRTELSAKLTQIMIQARAILPKAPDEAAAPVVGQVDAPASQAAPPAAPSAEEAPRRRRRDDDAVSSSGLILGGKEPPKGPPPGKIEIARR